MAATDVGGDLGVGRASRSEAAEHRAQIVMQAARLFKERGTNNVSIKEIMAQIGLTTGGMYGNFPSKEMLEAEAYRYAFDQLEQLLKGMARRNRGDRVAARVELLDYFLSPAYQDDMAGGCPVTALSSDAAHAAPDSLPLSVYIEGVQMFVAALADFTRFPEDTDEQLFLASNLVGAIALARATEGTPLSEAFLTSARRHL
jgi:TetR/AcrR family transcriptional regulator, transcriptional repressor for nem operon